MVITGAAGLIGAILRDRLRDYDVRGLDVRGDRDVDAVDMRDLDAVVRAFDGADAIVDLAADSDMDASWESVRDNNLPATWNALEGARRVGARRFVYASSNHVVGMYEHDEPYASIVAGRYAGLDPQAIPRLDSSTPIRPDGAYGVGKAFGEAAARYYADEHGLPVVCLRIGTVNHANRPTNARHFATLLTHPDLVQLVERCLAAPDDVRYAVFYGVSDNTWRIWDIDDARARVGYDPRDDAERFR